MRGDYNRRHEREPSSPIQNDGIAKSTMILRRDRKRQSPQLSGWLQEAAILFQWKRFSLAFTLAGKAAGR